MPQGQCPYMTFTMVFMGSPMQHSEETYLITAATMLTAKSMGLSELPTYNQGSSVCGTH